MRPPAQLPPAQRRRDRLGDELGRRFAEIVAPDGPKPPEKRDFGGRYWLPVVSHRAPKRLAVRRAAGIPSGWIWLGSRIKAGEKSPTKLEIGPSSPDTRASLAQAKSGAKRPAATVANGTCRAVKGAEWQVDRGTFPQPARRLGRSIWCTGRGEFLGTRGIEAGRSPGRPRLGATWPKFSANAGRSDRRHRAGGRCRRPGVASPRQNSAEWANVDPRAYDGGTIYVFGPPARTK